MAKKNINEFCCPSMDSGASCCRVESIVSVDERGQMVLAKEIREKANIRPGDKLVVISWGKEDAVSCLVFIKADDFAGIVKGLLGPMARDLIEGDLSKTKGG